MKSRSRIGVATLLLASAIGCADEPAPREEPAVATAPDAYAGVEWFTDAAAGSGLGFVHFNGMSGRFYQPEIMGPGAALFDYDNDGDLDVYLVQGDTLGSDPPLAPRPEAAPRDRLYRNDLAVDSEGQPSLSFTDVTSASGIVAQGYGMGVATGDIDNDGWIDLYLTRFGANQMFRNQGDGTFIEVSAASGTDDPSWSVSSAFVDADHDGWLDLFVGNYLYYSLEMHVPCFHPTGPENYCVPEMYRAQPSRFYRNRGDGTFTDVTAAAGMAREFGPALGVASADVNGDGWIDIFVANDQQENQLWVNQGDGTFRNLAALWGVALGEAGEAKADMGVDFGDFDNDGDEDLFITELTGQGSTLYVNDGSGLFNERSAGAGVRYSSLPYTGFGAGWIDFDNDGWLDVLAVNGLVVESLDHASSRAVFPLDQRNQLLRNRGDGRFEDVTDQAGAVFQLSEVSRGAAFGDVDNDGDTDVVVANAAGPARLLINGIGNRRHWVGLRLVGAAGRGMVGARVAVLRSDGTTLWRRARADGSYASANDPRVLVGLDSYADPVEVRVTWPSGREEAWRGIPVDRYTTLTEGGAP
ncbi:MAG: CRTAC1 family protein [Acidobacteria bacterium]|nr:CRTAC1 family protein [Acidobacteriota bacterium]MYJ06273.1 CRTAC1 family protein [Acidobacteriota bacterium]